MSSEEFENKSIQAECNEPKPADVLVGGGITLSVNCRTVIVNDTALRLTKIEFDILHLLMSNSGRVVTYKQLFDKVWGEKNVKDDLFVFWRTIERLRHKLIQKGSPEHHIRAEHGIGYIFVS